MLLQQAAVHKPLWDSYGLRLLSSLTSALNTLYASGPRESTLATALRVSRRALRTLFNSGGAAQIFNDSVTALAAKGSSPSPKNAITLGIIAGVCRRLPQRSSLVTGKKQDYNAFYLREVLGSRVQLPAYIADAMREYFVQYVDLEDLNKEIVPAVEKALLRAPEIVLNDIVAPMVRSLAPEIDLSEILAASLLKPLMSNIKSSNQTVRQGALHTFETIAARCKEDTIVEKIAIEILNPLKSNKVTAADQRVIHAQMLSALHVTDSLASEVPTGLAAVTSKEANEAAAAAEIAVMGKLTTYVLEHGAKPGTAVTDAFSKGLTEKRLPVRRLWALQFADCIWSLSDAALQQEGVGIFADACLGKLIDIWNEILTNPIPASQNGQIIVANAITALCLGKVSGIPNLKSASIMKKASVADRVLVLDPKPSFLLSPRVYTKLNSEDDAKWSIRALAASFPKLTGAGVKDAIPVAWAQSFIFFLVAQGIPVRARSEAVMTLQTIHTMQPKETAKIITSGLWRWCEDDVTANKDSAAIAAKSGRDELFKVVRSICVTPELVGKLGGSIDQSVIGEQMIDLLVLCRADLLPRASWIELCLRTGTDPGELARRLPQKCMEQIIAVTEVRKIRTVEIHGH